MSINVFKVQLHKLNFTCINLSILLYLSSYFKSAIILIEALHGMSRFDHISLICDSNFIKQLKPIHNSNYTILKGIRRSHKIWVIKGLKNGSLRDKPFIELLVSHDSICCTNMNKLHIQINIKPHVYMITYLSDTKIDL